MKKILASLLLVAMLAGCAACTKSPVTNETSDAESKEKVTESASETTGSNESDSREESEGASDTTSSEKESDTESQEIKLEGEHSEVISHAQSLANGIQTYYTTPDRQSYTIENKTSRLEYLLAGEADQMVASLANSKGHSYITDTMDVFVTMANGSKYYASASSEQTRVNLYRLGYYYYDVHLLEQDFIGDVKVNKSVDVNINGFTDYKCTSEPVINDGILTATIVNQADPHVINVTDVFKADEFNNLQFSFKSGCVGFITLYIKTGSNPGHTESNSVSFDVIADNEWHTYNVPLNSKNFRDYGGEISKFRFDTGGAVNGEFSIKDVKVQNVSIDSVPLSLDRVFHSFPDKLHHEVHIVAYENTKDISEIGIETHLEIDKVAKLIFKNAKGVTEFSVDGSSTKDISALIKATDWSSCEYIGFDVKEAGIFGYILPYDGNSGKIELTIKDGKLAIIQTSAPADGIINAPVNSTLNDFRMGHRIYTDENHDFEAFLKEAYCERNPLGRDNIVIDNAKMKRGAKFKGYDALRGVYTVTLPGALSFNDPYYNNQNLYYNASFSIKGDKYDRCMYFMASTSSGALECATILDENDLMLPIALQVSKNFSEQEEPFYNCGDFTYGEVFFPMTVNAGEREYVTILDFYQNWGIFPLKQLSSIGYYMPYYHLSTGTTETNCISPWYNRGKNLWTLPDHRPMSMPASSDLKNMYQAYGNQPQRPNAGYHFFLQYTDADGEYYASEYLGNEIHSYGPTYADVTMHYVSDDGKIKGYLRHMEMPQEDENRGYYEICYEVLDTVEIANFRDDFSFYSMAGFGNYKKVGFLNEKNKPMIRDINPNSSKVANLTLGSESPYFSLFYMPNVSEYANLSFLILDSEIIIEGEKCTAPFLIRDINYSLSLTLDLPEKVTLKAGDKFVINAIIMPWGGGYIDDNDVQLHPTEDINVQNVRLNSLINRFVAAPVSDVADCESVNSVFLPRVRSKNGESATFTVSGGCDIDAEKADVVNMALRVDGINDLGKLKIEELVDGNWIVYDTSSASKPDNSGNSHSFDGYAVHYDGNGTYSYSFVAAFTDGNSRTFRVTVE